jgi:hypothetical protein
MRLNARAGIWATAAGLCLALFVVYNANGREIASYDSLPTKLTARELLLRRTLNLNHEVGAMPALAKRWGFVVGDDGCYRSVYSPAPAIMAAVVTWPFSKMGVVDLQAPRAPALMAKVTASLLVALAAALAFVSARQRLPQGRAILLAIGLGLGTGYWSMASQTLWQTETAVFGLALAVVAFAAPRDQVDTRAAIAIGVGLGLAGVARPQLAPMVAVLLAGTWVRATPRPAVVATAIVLASGVALCAANLRWFGDPLGAQVLLQGVSSQIHGTRSTFVLGPAGFAGLLVSPSRGLIVFSPVVLVAFAGIRRAISEGWRSPLPWCVLAITAQYVLYGSYAVWWAGHTYGPRYLIDVLPVAVPLAAVAMRAPRLGRVGRIAAGIALAWSIAVAATGAFCYPHELWNSDPEDVDRDHSRLWSVSDNQIVRCWKAGLSPQNFRLMHPTAFRNVPE